MQLAAAVMLMPLLIFCCVHRSSESQWARQPQKLGLPLGDLSQWFLVCLTVCLLTSKATCPNFNQFILYILPVALARTSFDGNALCYVRPVLWLISFFHIMNRKGHKQRRRASFVQFARWRHWAKSAISYYMLSCQCRCSKCRLAILYY